MDHCTCAKNILAWDEKCFLDCEEEKKFKTKEVLVGYKNGRKSLATEGHVFYYTAWKLPSIGKVS